MDELIEFVAARLDEEQYLAQDLARGHPGPWSADTPSSVCDSGGKVVVQDEYHWSAIPHIARHDPARVLRDVAADRKLLAEWQQAEADSAEDDDQWKAGFAAGLRDAVLHRAKRFSGHPDYEAAVAALYRSMVGLPPA